MTAKHTEKPIIIFTTLTGLDGRSNFSITEINLEANLFD